MNETRALAAFAAMSNKTRLRMLKALVAAGPDGLSAGDIAARVKASPSRASFHLSHMAEAGLIRATKQARSVVYAVDFASVGALVQFLIEDCCGNNPVVLNCCGPKS